MGSNISSVPPKETEPRKYLTRLQKKRNEDKIGHAMMWVKNNKRRLAVRDLTLHPRIIKVRWSKKRYDTDPPGTTQVSFEYLPAEVDGGLGLGPMAIDTTEWEKTWLMQGPYWQMGHPDSQRKDKLLEGMK